MKKKMILFVAGLMLIAASMACSLGSDIQDAVGGALSEAINMAIETAASEYGLDLPTDKISAVSIDNGAIQMTVDAEFDAMVLFMQASAENNGMVENPLTTVIEDGVASMIYTNQETGIGVVIQIVDLDNGTVSINIRRAE